MRWEERGGGRGEAGEEWVGERGEGWEQGISYTLGLREGNHDTHRICMQGLHLECAINDL